MNECLSAKILKIPYSHIIKNQIIFQNFFCSKYLDLIAPSNIFCIMLSITFYVKNLSDLFIRKIWHKSYIFKYVPLNYDIADIFFLSIL